ncbi:MAG: hypothetical protein PHH06_02540 [Candidatus Gracilibacteria bacterium]|nr:hypothetical protein [Candidatus Gracilibacteria bacterium]
MIKVKASDNIYDIIYKIEKDLSIAGTGKSLSKIILEIPFGHPVLHNYLALKSLKNKAGDKKLIITTTDIASKKIGKELGIKYTIIKDKGFIEDDKNILKYNYTFFEYFKYEIKKYIKKFIYIFSKNKKIIDSTKYYQKYYKQKSNISLFLALLTLTIFIFLYIFYFALNNTSIYITPAIRVQTKSLNFTFSENENDKIFGNKEEKLLKIEKTINLEKEFNTTGIKQDERYRATGEVEFINNYTDEVKLRPSTRLLSKEGITYEITNWITVPGAKKNGAGDLIPGITKAVIRSKLIDNKGLFIGERGNLSQTGVILSIPGLDNTDIKMHANTITPIVGGKDEYINIVAENDEENAKKLMIEKLQKQAIEEIYSEIAIQNETNNITFKVLDIDNIYTFKDIEIEILNNLTTGEELKSFKVKGKITAYTYAYNINSIISKLKTEIEAGIIPEKEKILFINDKSIRISNIINKEEKPFSLRATIEIEVFLSHNFENEDDNYVQRLKNTITGLSKEEAEKILINESKISNVKIDINPFFLKNVSNFYNNIRFFIEE